MFDINVSLRIRFLPLVEMTLIKATFYLPSKKKEA